MSLKSVGLPIARGKLVNEFNFHKEDVNLPCRLYKRNKYKLFKKAGENKTSQSQNVLDWQRERANFTSVNVSLCDCHPHLITYNYYEFRHCLMTVMTNRFYAPKGRHIVIKLPFLSVLSV